MNYKYYLGLKSQTEMAKELQISQKSISNYLKNKIPSIEILLELSKRYNVSLDELCDNKKNVTLTEKQQELLEKIKNMDDENINRVLGYIDSLNYKKLSTQEKINNILKDFKDKE